MDLPPTNPSVPSEQPATLPEEKPSLSPEQEKTKKVAEEAIPKEIKEQPSLAKSNREVKISTAQSPREETINRIEKQKILELQKGLGGVSAESLFEDESENPHETTEGAEGRKPAPVPTQFLDEEKPRQIGEEPRSESPVSIKNPKILAQESGKVEAESKSEKKESKIEKKDLGGVSAESLFEDESEDPHEATEGAEGRKPAPVPTQFLGEERPRQIGEEPRPESPVSIKNLNMVSKESETVEEESEEEQTQSEEVKTRSEGEQTQSGEVKTLSDEAMKDLRDKFSEFLTQAKEHGFSDQEIDSLSQAFYSVINTMHMSGNIKEMLPKILNELESKLSPRAYAFLLSFIKKEFSNELRFLDEKKERKITHEVFKEAKTQPSSSSRLTQVKEATISKELSSKAAIQQIEHRKESRREKTLQETAMRKKTQKEGEELLNIKKRLEYALEIITEEINKMEKKTESRQQEEKRQQFKT